MTNKTIHFEIHTVPEIETPMRLQEYGVGIFNATITKSALKKVLKKKYITVNDVIATTATFINGGEIIKLSMPQEDGSKTKLIFPLKVLFEDDHLAVIHKPAGILVSGNGFMTVANALSQNLKRSSLPNATLPQPVHRLDYATTGILLVGKTRDSIRELNKLFINKTIEKKYYAITIGEMETQGVVTTDVDGKASKSVYHVQETVISERFGKLNLVKLEPKTGRRHQLRVHMASIEHPILGDKEYGIEPLILNGKGMYLHAYSLKFMHPSTNEELFVTSELPKKFKKIFPSLE